MKWIKSSTTQPPSDGTTFFALFNDIPCLVEYDGDYKEYTIASIDPLPQTIKKTTNISHWCKIEKP